MDTAKRRTLIEVLTGLIRCDALSEAEYNTLIHICQTATQRAAEQAEESEE